MTELSKEIIESNDPSVIYEKVRQESLRGDLGEIYSEPKAPQTKKRGLLFIQRESFFVLLGLEIDVILKYYMKSVTLPPPSTTIESSTAGGFIELYELLDKQVSALFLKKNASSVFVLFKILYEQKPNN
jgi:hypothetical protein